LSCEQALAHDCPRRGPGSGEPFVAKIPKSLPRTAFARQLRGSYANMLGYQFQGKNALHYSTSTRERQDEHIPLGYKYVLTDMVWLEASAGQRSLWLKSKMKLLKCNQLSARRWKNNDVSPETRERHRHDRSRRCSSQEGLLVALCVRDLVDDQSHTTLGDDV